MTTTETDTCPGLACTTPLHNGYLCSKCARRAERAIGDLPALVRDLADVTVARLARVERGSNGKARGVTDEDWRGSAHALAQIPAPADVAASDRGRAILELLFEWCDFVAQCYGDKGLPLFSRALPLPGLAAQAAGTLLRRAEFLRLNEQGPMLAEAIHSVRRDLRRVVDTRPMRLYAGPCHADMGYGDSLGYDTRCPHALFREWGRDTVVCDGYEPQPLPGSWYPTGCGTGHPAAERDEFMVAAVEESLLPLRLLWASLHLLVPGVDVDWKTCQQWTRDRETRVPMRDEKGNVKRDKLGRERIRIAVTPARLEPVSVTIDGVELYRGSDVLRLARDEGRRRGRKRTRLSA